MDMNINTVMIIKMMEQNILGIGTVTKTMMKNVFRISKTEETVGVNNEFENKIKIDSGYIFSDSYDRELSDGNNAAD